MLVHAWTSHVSMEPWCGQAVRWFKGPNKAKHQKPQKDWNGQVFWGGKSLMAWWEGKHFLGRHFMGWEIPNWEGRKRERKIPSSPKLRRVLGFSATCCPALLISHPKMKELAVLLWCFKYQENFWNYLKKCDFLTMDWVSEILVAFCRCFHKFDLLYRGPQQAGQKVSMAKVGGSHKWG